MKLLLLLAAIVCSSATANSIVKETSYLWNGIKSQVTKFEHEFETFFQKNKNLSEDKIHKSPKVFAVLVAGSNGFYNYRHQVSLFIYNSFFKKQSFEISLRQMSVMPTKF